MEHLLKQLQIELHALQDIEREIPSGFVRQHAADEIEVVVKKLFKLKISFTFGRKCCPNRRTTCSRCNNN